MMEALIHRKIELSELSIAIGKGVALIHTLLKPYFEADPSWRTVLINVLVARVIVRSLR